MSDHEAEIVHRMYVLRSQGTRVASMLPADLDRATDWREHVRANPVPALVGAAVLGFWLVPARKCSSDERSDGDDSARRVRQDDEREVPKQQKAGMLANPLVAALGSWAGHWVMSRASGAAQRFASEQLHSLTSGFMGHGSATQQRGRPASGAGAGYAGAAPGGRSGGRDAAY